MNHTRTASTLLAGSLLAALTPIAAIAQIQLPADHVDFGIGYDDNALELHWHYEEGGEEYAPGDAFAHIPLFSSVTRPAGAQWDFTGAVAGETIYLAPASSSAGVIFLGIGAEEIANGTFVDNTVTLTLDSVSGPGAFALWQTNGFGSPLVALSTSAEIGSFDITTGGHDHYNWGFTAPGVYELTFTVSGILDDGLSTFVTDTATFTFGVGTTAIPEPSAFAALGGAAALALSATRRRRRV